MTLEKIYLACRNIEPDAPFVIHLESGDRRYRTMDDVPTSMWDKKTVYKFYVNDNEEVEVWFND